MLMIFHFFNYAPDINPRLDEDEQFAHALQESMNDRPFSC
jgi:hypothetical protein